MVFVRQCELPSGAEGRLTKETSDLATTGDLRRLGSRAQQVISFTRRAKAVRCVRQQGGFSPGPRTQRTLGLRNFFILW